MKLYELMGRGTRACRYVWAMPNSIIGLLIFLPFACRCHIARKDGVIELCSPGLAWVLRNLPLSSGVIALTLGHVVLGRDPDCLAASRAHERVHVAQYERWGPLFLPAYLLATVVAFVQGRHPYEDNHFERLAFAVADPRPVMARRGLRRIGGPT